MSNAEHRKQPAGLGRGSREEASAVEATESVRGVFGRGLREAPG